MFVVYAIPVGIVVGALLGGRLDRLGLLRLRWVPVILVGLVLQLSIFTDAGARLVGDAGPALYLASTALVLVAVLRNLAIPGVALIAVGAGTNLMAIAANGGRMPVDPSALSAVGGFGPGPTNDVLLAAPALGPLTDLFALPAWLPLANVFSVGDVVIGLGIVGTIAIAMRTATPAAPRGGAS